MTKVIFYSQSNYNPDEISVTDYLKLGEIEMAAYAYFLLSNQNLILWDERSEQKLSALIVCPKKLSALTIMTIKALFHVLIIEMAYIIAGGEFGQGFWPR